MMSFDTSDRARRGTLVQRFAVRVAMATLVAVALVAALGYWVTFTTLEDRELARLEAYVLERGRAESEIFGTAEREAATFGRLFMEAYLSAPPSFSDDFDRYFRRGEDGEWRTVPELYAGTWTPEGDYFRYQTGFISAVQDTVTPDLRRRLVIALRVLARMAPGTNPEMGLHATFPENAIVLSDDIPWGLDARSDLDMTAGSVVGATLQSQNPERRPVWTGLYYDLTAEDWAITYQLPVDHEGRHLITPSNDARLSDLIRRVQDPRTPGTRNMILSADGALVAHPQRLDEMLQARGEIELEEVGDPTLLDYHRRVMAAGPIGPEAATIVEDPTHDVYLGVVRLQGPDWWWITEYPTAALASAAHRGARLMVLLGLLFFVLTMGVVHWFLRNLVSRPIGVLTSASEMVAAGDYTVVADGLVALPEDRDDEIGLLARTFRRMASSLRATRQLDDALFLTDDGGRIMEANPAAGRLTGRDASALVGDRLYALGSEDDADRIREVFEHLDPDRPTRTTMSIPRAGEPDIPVELSIRSFDTPAGVRCITTARDISERIRQHEEHLRIERRSLDARRFEALGKMAGGMAHEFNNILAAILGNAELVREQLPAGSDLDGPMAEVARAARRAAGLTRQMFAYAGESMPMAHREAVDLSQLCLQVVRDGTPSERIDVQLDLDPDLPELRADPNALRDLIDALLENSTEALEEVDLPGTITVRTYIDRYPEEVLATAMGQDLRPGRYVTLEVSDSGVGFDDDVASRMFDPFFSTKFDGRGLGLSAVVGIARAHGGAVLAGSDPGRGARFRVLLPPGTG